MPIFWLALTILMIIWYTFTVIIVAIRGYQDLKKMFKNMKRN